MGDFKFPVDGTTDGTELLTADRVIDYPEDILGDGPFIVFEFFFTGITVLDKDVEFKFFAGLSVEGLDGANVSEVIASVEIGGLSGDLTFLRQISATALGVFRTVLTGTNPGSTADYIIRVRSNI